MSSAPSMRSGRPRGRTGRPRRRQRPRSRSRAARRAGRRAPSSGRRARRGRSARAASRRSQTWIGVKVLAGPLAPASSPAMTRTTPSPAGGSPSGSARLSMPWYRGGAILSLGGQVDPELHHLESPPRRANSRPWNSSWTMPEAAVIHCTSPGRSAAAAGRVAVLDLARVDDGHRLETAMRMLADAAALGRRRELHRAGVVEEQERCQHRTEVRVREERADGKAVAHPVAIGAALDAPELLQSAAHVIRREHGASTGVKRK